MSQIQTESKVQVQTQMQVQLKVVELHIHSTTLMCYAKHEVGSQHWTLSHYNNENICWIRERSIFRTNLETWTSCY